jgi:Ca2+-binding EF-hand superfamily protein
MGVSPEELAAVTAEQAFDEADLNDDGRLSFDEFQKWFSKDSETKQAIAQAQESIQSIPAVSLSDMRRILQLDQFDPEDVFELFALAADDAGQLHRAAFEDCFEEFIEPSQLSLEDLEKSSLIINRIFDIFDANGNGVVDYAELTSGLSILCGGSSKDRVRSAFLLYDVNGDGFISMEEMVQYLTCVFKLMYNTQPGTMDKIGATPDELAAVTAKTAFEEADLNHDGKLSFEEFSNWYSSGGSFFSGASAPPSAGAGAAFPAATDTQPAVEMSLARVRQLTKLDIFFPADVVEMLAEASTNGYVARADFTSIARAFIQLGGENEPSDVTDAASIVSEIFDAFASADDTAEMDELAAGLTVLCAGTRDGKVEAAFKIFDRTDDGFISIVEARRYLTSVYKVLYLSEPGMEASMGASAEELGRITATHAFSEASLNHDGRLSLAEFQKWYSKAL